MRLGSFWNFHLQKALESYHVTNIQMKLSSAYTFPSSRIFGKAIMFLAAESRAHREYARRYKWMTQTLEAFMVVFALRSIWEEFYVKYEEDFNSNGCFLHTYSPISWIVWYETKAKFYRNSNVRECNKAHIVSSYLLPGWR